MKAWLATVAFICGVTLLSTSAASVDVPDPGSPHYANRMLDFATTSTIVPPDNVRIHVTLTNPFSNLTQDMVNISLTIGVYRYATQDRDEYITEDFPNPPLIAGISTERTVLFDRIPPDEPDDLNDTFSEWADFPFWVSEKTPHGSYFSQATYFVRFNLSFNFEGNSSVVVLKSRGSFTDEQWNTMVSWESGDAIVNTTYMRSLGVDGLLPDTSFGIKVPIPRWPLAVIIAAAGSFSFMGLYYYVLDNPGKHPMLEKRFYYLRGKLSEFRSQAKYRRGK